jgi:hypothetical protein
MIYCPIIGTTSVAEEITMSAINYSDLRKNCKSTVIFHPNGLHKAVAFLKEVMIENPRGAMRGD